MRNLLSIWHVYDKLSNCPAIEVGRTVSEGDNRIFEEMIGSNAPQENVSLFTYRNTVKFILGIVNTAIDNDTRLASDQIQEIALDLSNIGPRETRFFGNFFAGEISLGYPARFGSVIKSQVDKFLNGNLSGSKEPLLYLFNTKQINWTAVFDVVNGEKSDQFLNALEQGTSPIFAAIRGNPNEEIAGLSSKESYSLGLKQKKSDDPNFKLEAFIAFLNNDIGVDPHLFVLEEDRRATAISFFLELVDRQRLKYDNEQQQNVRNLLHEDIREPTLLYLPNAEDLSAKSINELDEIWGMGRLQHLDAGARGNLLRIYLHYMQDQGVGEEAKQLIQTYLVKDQLNNRLYDQLGLPRILELNSSRNKPAPSELELILGFMGKIKATQRSNLKQFHEITKNRFIEDYSYEKLSRLINPQPKAE